MVDGRAQGGDFGVVRMQLHPAFETSADCDTLQLVGELLDGPHFSALKAVQDQQEGRYKREQQAHKAKNRHLFSLADPVVRAHLPDALCQFVMFGCAAKTSISQRNLRSVCISPYLVARTLGRHWEKP
jgi:hypothetical protein